jgi:diguanylate cyclase (GGDEF)-like protein
VVSSCLVYLAVLGAVDAQLYESVSFSVYYIVPVAFTAWFAGRRSGFAMACLSAVVMLASNLYYSGVRIAWIIHIWNAGMNGTMFSAMAFLLDYLRRVLTQEKILAVRDPLTGLCNRRGFFERLEDEARRARRYGRSFSLAVIDIDDFKAVNDFGGHARGDRLLQAISAGMKRVLRSADLAARIGGDEFAVLFPETPREGAREAVKRLLAALAEATAVSGTVVTFSVGVASCPEDGTNADDIVNRADLLMYKAKKGGKNRVEYAA